MGILLSTAGELKPLGKSRQRSPCVSSYWLALLESPKIFSFSSECSIRGWKKDRGQKNPSGATETQKHKVRGQLPSGLMYP